MYLLYQGYSRKEFLRIVTAPQVPLCSSSSTAIVFPIKSDFQLHLRVHGRLQQWGQEGGSGCAPAGSGSAFDHQSSLPCTQEAGRKSISLDSALVSFESRGKSLNTKVGTADDSVCLMFLFFVLENIKQEWTINN